MRKAVLMAGTLGLFVALLTGSTWFYLYNRGLSGTSGARVFASISHYAWPSSILMMDADHLDFGTVLLFVMSSLVNAIIYGIIGFCLYFVWRRVFATNRTLPT